MTIEKIQEPPAGPTRLAGVVKVESGSQHARLVIDGWEFPFHLAEDSVHIHPGGGKSLAAVQISILADRVEVLDTGVDPFPGEGDQA